MLPPEGDRCGSPRGGKGPPATRDCQSGCESGNVICVSERASRRARLGYIHPVRAELRAALPAGIRAALVQQERPDEVNRLLIEFVTNAKALS